MQQLSKSGENLKNLPTQVVEKNTTQYENAILEIETKHVDTLKLLHQKYIDLDDKLSNILISLQQNIMLACSDNIIHKNEVKQPLKQERKATTHTNVALIESLLLDYTSVVPFLDELLLEMGSFSNMYLQHPAQGTINESDGLTLEKITKLLEKNLMFDQMSSDCRIGLNEVEDLIQNSKNRATLEIFHGRMLQAVSDIL